MRVRFGWVDFLLVGVLACGCWMFALEFREAGLRSQIFDTGPVPSAMGEPFDPRRDAPVRESDFAAVWSLLDAPSPTRRGFAPAASEPVGAPFQQLPMLFGVADLGAGPTALLSAGPGERAQWTVPGQTIGSFTLVQVSATELVFARDGRRIAATPAELREGPRRIASPPRASTAPRRLAGVPGIRTRSTPRPPNGTGRYRVGTEFRPGRFAADAADGATDGTVFEGYVRRVRETPFGTQHWWERRDP